MTQPFHTSGAGAFTFEKLKSGAYVSMYMSEGQTSAFWSNNILTSQRALFVPRFEMKAKCLNTWLTPHIYTRNLDQRTGMSHTRAVVNNFHMRTVRVELRAHGWRIRIDVLKAKKVFARRRSGWDSKIPLKAISWLYSNNLKVWRTLSAM